MHTLTAEDMHCMFDSVVCDLRFWCLNDPHHGEYHESHPAIEQWQPTDDEQETIKTHIENVMSVLDANKWDIEKWHNVAPHFLVCTDQCLSLNKLRICELAGVIDPDERRELYNLRDLVKSNCAHLAISFCDDDYSVELVTAGNVQDY